jgi:hypothetical protein
MRIDRNVKLLVNQDMLPNVMGLLAITIISAAISGGIGLVRKKNGWKDFDAWWDSEGVPIFILIWFVLGIIFYCRGYLVNL